MNFKFNKDDSSEEEFEEEDAEIDVLTICHVSL